MSGGMLPWHATHVAGFWKTASRQDSGGRVGQLNRPVWAGREADGQTGRRADWQVDSTAASRTGAGAVCVERRAVAAGKRGSRV